jgi:DNA-binding NarL/FixJ family response regulator
VTVPLKARLMIADDHAMVRRGLRMILDSEPDLEVVAEAGDGAEAVDVALREELDLAVLDVAMPRLTGLQAAHQLAARRPELKLLILTMHDSEAYLFEALRVGATGFVLKSAVDRDLVEACRAVLRGESWIHPGGVSALIKSHRRQDEQPRPAEPLTPREAEVVKLIAEGHTTKEIAETLVISPKTVERHRANILEKLELRDRVDLTRWAIRRGLVEP